MLDFSRRSNKKELIDSPETLPPGEMEKTLRELRLVNRWLGGAETALGPARRELLRLQRARTGGGPMSARSGSAQPPLRVLDVGAGGADIALRLARWAEKQGIPVRIVAVDFNPRACTLAARYLGSRSPETPRRGRARSGDGVPNEHDRQAGAGHASAQEPRAVHAQTGTISLVAGDVFHLPFPPSAFDVVLCSAFLHHFGGEDAVKVLHSLGRAGREALIVNDLHRHPLAYWGFRLLSGLFSRSQAVRHDGPVSVLRGFIRPELRKALEQAGFSRPSISWRWAFRWRAVAEIQPK